MWFDSCFSVKHSPSVSAKRCSCTPRILTVYGIPPKLPHCFIDVLSELGAVSYSPMDQIAREGQARVGFHDSRMVPHAIKSIQNNKAFRNVTFDCNNHSELAFCIDYRSPVAIAESVKAELEGFGGIAFFSVSSLNGEEKVLCSFYDTRDAYRAAENPLLTRHGVLRGRVIPVPHETVCPELESKRRGSSTSTIDYEPYFERTSPSAPRAIPIDFPSLNFLESSSHTSESTMEYDIDVWAPKESLRFNSPKLSPKKAVPFIGNPVMGHPPDLVPGGPRASQESVSEKPAKKAAPKHKSRHTDSEPLNKVQLDRIALGVESRTTIMIRNIPNKLTQATLKTFLDETSENRYDFLYLRIDFGNQCNVGYAFVNFLTPLDVADFAKARCGKKWSQCNSEKILDVCFANFQGKHSLIDKFKNSPIMTRDPSHRPKLYHTSGPMIGQEQAFPIEAASH